MHDDRLLPLIETDRPRLVRAATRLLGPTEAEDAVQDAYLRALEADAMLQLNVAQAWLLTVVRNLAIDRLRRRKWLQQWLAEASAARSSEPTTPSAEADAARAQEAVHALRLLAAHLAPADGAALLLHEVFEASHAEIALASGKTEAGSRQQLRRALLRLPKAGGAHLPHPERELDPTEEATFRLYLQSLQLRDPQTLWAMLNQPVVRAAASLANCAKAPAMAAAAPSLAGVTTSAVVQMGGQLGLVLTLDGITLCVLPLGVQAERDEDPVPV
ncbi:sigma-70 family RNA polymerase sigma factor [Acidovorax sp. 69]|uniref:sigma-70 family RNA polymerase sigma factor n=1 Tax=Acidovorax sp. 69 TaxID=2035202 RepID=UPI000C240710|nr:sigma-70 family RNA polymerase sigma factor [Acidovorax sp. 69]